MADAPILNVVTKTDVQKAIPTRYAGPKVKLIKKSGKIKAISRRQVSSNAY